jgi:hypothetical protein
MDLVKYLDKIEISELRDKVDDPKKDLNKVIKDDIEPLQAMLSDDIKKYNEDANKEDSSDDARAKASRTASNINKVLDGCTKLLSFVTSFYARKAACERAIYTKIGAIDGVKLTAGDKAEQVKNVSKAAADAAKDKAKDAAGKVVNAAKGAKEAVKSKLTNEAAEDLEYQFMSIDVVNEAYIEELFA